MSLVFDNDRFRKLLFSFPGKAIGFLFERYYNGLIRIANSLTHDSEISEDLVQETFVHVWEHHKRLGQHHERSIQYYLVRVVKNKSISYYKRTQVLKAKQWDSQDVRLSDNHIEQQIIRLELSNEIRRVIDTFPRREKECLLMRMDEEMTLDQMALRMNVSRKAVERSMTSASKRLRKYWLSKK